MVYYLYQHGTVYIILLHKKNSCWIVVVVIKWPLISLLWKKTYVLLFVVYLTMKKYKNIFLWTNIRIIFIIVFVRNYVTLYCAVNIMWYYWGYLFLTAQRKTKSVISVSIKQFIIIIWARTIYPWSGVFPRHTQGLVQFINIPWVGTSLTTYPGHYCV